MTMFECNLQRQVFCVSRVFFKGICKQSNVINYLFKFKVEISFLRDKIEVDRITRLPDSFDGPISIYRFERQLFLI